MRTINPQGVASLDPRDLCVFVCVGGGHKIWLHTEYISWMPHHPGHTTTAIWVSLISVLK